LSNSQVFLMTSTLVPKNSQKCLASAVAAPTQWDTWFWMSRANASKSGMDMWPGTYVNGWLTGRHQFFGGGGRGEGVGVEREGGSWR
jgi:hypothetical protein